MATRAVLVVLLVSAALITLLTRAEVGRAEVEVRDQTLVRSSLIHSRIEHALQQRVEIAHEVAALVEADPNLSATAFHRFSVALRAREPELRALQVVRNGRIALVDPVRGNEAAVGLDLGALVGRRPELRRALLEGVVTLEGPVELTQGGSGLIFRLPFAPTASVPGRWELIQVVVDLDTILGEAGLTTDEPGTLLTLRAGSDRGATADLITAVGAVGNQPARGTDIVRTRIAIPGGMWELTAAPSPTWELLPSRAWAVIAVGSAFALVAALLVWTIMSEPERLRARVRCATDELARSRDYVQTILDAAPDAILAVDGELVVIDANQAAHDLFSVAGERVVGRGLDELVADGRAFTEHDGFARPHGRTEMMAHAAGGDVVAEVSLAWAPGAHALGTVMIRDITRQREIHEDLRIHAGELERLNHELSAMDQLKREFVSVASHEIRTPLTAIRGFAAVMSRHWREMTDSDRSDGFEVLLRQADRLSRLIDDLLVAGHIESGTLESVNEPTDVDALIRECLSELIPTPADVHVEVGDDTPVLVARGHLTRIIGAFLTNAVRYGGSPITILSHSTADRVEIRVIDRGRGVDDDFVPRLFERFTQASTGDRRTARGTGLGLAIARELAEVLDGTVWYERADHGGACFGVCLPCEPAPSPRARPPLPTAASA